MRYHTTRPSQQQPLQSVIGGLYTSSPTYPNSGSFASSPPPSTVLSNSPKAMAATTCESSSSSHVPSTPDPCNPKTNSPLSFPDSGTSCLSHSSCNTSRLTIPSGQISNSSIPPTHSAPTSPTRSHSNITAYGDKAMTKWLAHWFKLIHRIVYQCYVVSAIVHDLEKCCLLISLRILIGSWFQTHYSILSEYCPFLRV